MLLLIRGGSGFLGSALAKTFADTEHTIRLFCRSPSKVPDRLRRFSNVEIFEGDACSNVDVEKSLIGVDAVFEFCGGSIPRDHEKGLLHEMGVSVMPLAILLDQMVNSGVSRIVYASSGGTVYGRTNNRPLKECDDTTPINHYGLGKLLSERLIQYSAHQNQMQYLIMRMGNVYGRQVENSREQGLVEKAIAACQRGEAVTIWGSGEEIRDYLFIDDLVDVALRLFSQESWNQIVNVASGTGLSVQLVVDAVLANFPDSPEPIHVRTPSGLDSVVLDVSKLQRLIGEFSPLDIESGVKATILRMSKATLV